MTGESPVVTVRFTPKVASTIEKNGSLDRARNPDKATWTVDVNKELDKVVDAKVAESWPEGIIFNSVAVYKLDVDVKGNVTQGAEIDPSAYDVDADGNIAFKGTIHSAYRLIYQTTIDNNVKPNDGGWMSFKNTATFSGKDIDGIDAEASVAANYGKTVEKNNTGYDGDTQTFSWEINYNYGEKHINRDQAFVTDTFDPKLELDKTSLKIVPITFDTFGNEQRGTELVEGTDYIIVESGNSFTIKFQKDIDGAYKLVYSTKVKDGVIIDQPAWFSNHAVAGNGGTGDSGGQANQQNIVKGYANINYTDKTVDWNLTINKNAYEMNHWNLDDTFTSGGLQYVDGSLKIIDAETGYQLERDKDYTFTLKDNNQGFHLTFIGDYDKTSSKFTMSYTTQFNADFSNQKRIQNTATVSWYDKDGNKHTNDANAGFDVNNETQFNGFKNGSYNAVDKRITWNVGVNYNGEKAGNASITDPITGNQKFVPGSVLVRSYTIRPDGSIEEGDPLDRSKYDVIEPSENNHNTLTVTFKTDSDDDRPYMVTFNTSLANQIVNDQSSYTNTATYHNEGHPNRSITGTVSISNGGIFATKNGAQDGNYVNWFVNVNSSQSALDDVTLTDDPSENQVLDESSFKVYEAQYDQNGAVLRDGNLVANTGKELLRGEDYTLKVTTDSITGKQRFVLKFVGAYRHIDRAYVVQYRSLLNIAGFSENVSNKVSVRGDHVQTITQDTTQIVPVAVSTGGGSATGEKGTLRIQKQGVLGQQLKDAVFELWVEDGGQLLRTGATADDGTLVLGNIRYGQYLLKEVGAPVGYTISDELLHGIKVSVNARSSQAGVYTTITDKQNLVTLTKKSANGRPLPGAVFKLEKEMNHVYLPYDYGSQIRSNVAGKIVLAGLPAGLYRLTEIQAPAGYLVNTTPIDFAVQKKPSGQTPDVDAGTLTDYQGSARLVKTDSNGKGLEGAIFKIVSQNGTVVQEGLTSDKDGRITSAETLASGKYFFIETKAPAGYLLNQDAIGFTVPAGSAGKPVAVDAGKAVNYQGSAELVKVDADGKGLEGAEFKIIDAKGNTIQNHLKSDQNGKIGAGNLPPGNYSFVETKAPAGYLLNTDPLEFTIDRTASGAPVAVSAGKTINYKGSVELVKTDPSGKPIEGALFELRTAGGVPVQKDLKSGTDGRIVIDGLEPGDYQVAETQAADGYLLDPAPRSFTIKSKSAGKPETIRIMKENTQNSVVLTKVDRNNPDIGLAGAQFVLTDKDGRTVTAGAGGRTLPDVWTTDGSGRFTVGGLSAGEYQFIETGAPNGYELDPTPVPFAITAADEKAIAITAADKLNRVILTKVDAEDQDIHLPGAEFKLYDKNNKLVVKDVNGKKLPAVWITDSNGQFTVSGLAPGAYHFIETEAPKDYELDAAPISFKVANTTAKAITIIAADKLTPGHVRLTKVNQENRHIRVHGAEFKLTDDQGRTLKTGLTTDRNGRFMVEDLEPGKYFFIETKAPAGYQLDSEPIPFTIARGQKKAVEITALNQPVPDIERGLASERQNESGPASGRQIQRDQLGRETSRTKNEGTLPKTGDTNDIMMLAMGTLLLLGAGSLAVYLRKRRKN